MDEPRFVDNEDGTVTDRWTQLMWMKGDSYLELKKFINHPQAVKYMKLKNQEAFAGYADWRLPDKREAHSLFDKNKTIKDKYDMEIHLDPVFSPGCGYATWTSNTRGKITAYVYSFNSGQGGHKEADEILNVSVRLVRGQFDNSRVKVGKVPEFKETTIKGGGWR